MRVFKDACEIALSKADLEHALWLWVRHCTMAGIDDFKIAGVT